MSESEQYMEMLKTQHLELMAEVKRLNDVMASIQSATTTQTQLWENQFKAMSSGLKALYLVWASIAFLGINTWLFYEGKIDQWVWGSMNLVIMTPFFADGIKMVLPIFGRSNTRTQE